MKNIEKSTYYSLWAHFRARWSLFDLVNTSDLERRSKAYLASMCAHFRTPNWYHRLLLNCNYYHILLANQRNRWLSGQYCRVFENPETGHLGIVKQNIHRQIRWLQIYSKRKDLHRMCRILLLIEMQKKTISFFLSFFYSMRLPFSKNELYLDFTLLRKVFCLFCFEEI